ncbi:MAG: peptidase U32 family protein, partial [Terriglobia bacterium]
MVELMAPAGSLEGARTALAAGADAVYAGLTNLSLRPARAEFNDEEFAQIVSLAHDRSKKVYAVLNVFLKDEDLALFDSELAAVNRMGADAVLVADAGAIEAVRTRYPNLPIHVSVQNSVTTPETAKFYEKLGASVIVLSRNTTDFSEIKR